MNKNHGKKISGIEWQCSHCGAFNKVLDAKFCGKCGSIRKKEPILPPAKNLLLNYLKTFIHPSTMKLYKTVIASAALLLVASVLSGYKMYTNVNTIHITKTKFSDVPIDHPIYSVCKNLLEIDAISFRKQLELAPYEEISASEWNHILNQASKYLNTKYSASAYFSKNDSVSIEKLNNKLKELSTNSREIADTSRIQSFYILEQTLFY